MNKPPVRWSTADVRDGITTIQLKQTHFPDADLSVWPISQLAED
jgi:hypothetical protein